LITNITYNINKNTKRSDKLGKQYKSYAGKFVWNFWIRAGFKSGGALSP